MIKILSVIIFFSLLMLLYKKYQVSVEKKKLMSYIVVINQDVKVTDHKKKTTFTLFSRLLDQDFVFILGVKNIVSSVAVLLFYLSFWTFCSLTFELSVITSFFGIVCLIALWIYFVISQFNLMFSDYFESNFPSALRMISRNMAVGQTIYAAIDAAAQNIHGIMQKEFQRISDQLRNGATFEQVLDKGEKLYPYKGYFVFSSYIKVSVKKGGSLKDTLLSLADDLISAQVIKKKTKALTSEARGAAKILAFLPLIMLGVLYSFSRENFLYLFDAYYGRIVVIYAVISVTVGFVIISKMIREVEL
jgi:Flp pilus assembly protein TadB